MIPPGKHPGQQAGAALLIVLVGLLLTASYAWYRNANTANFTRQQQTELNTRLLRAKEALIARAVTDANRPGSLPCPDLITDDNGLSNHPNDGKADNLTRNDCPSYLGWLPWVTLDLAELTDSAGNRLWYALARPLRDDDLAQPINSDTSTALWLDGRSDIAALIIAPGAALNGQNRPSNRPGDYLEGDNANGDSQFVSGPGSDSFNDVVLALSRQELMNAVEKRVAGEVRACLEEHAAAPANRWHEYPWPAPFASSALRGKAGSYFGQVPSTQAGPGPQLELTASTADLLGAQNRLDTASNPGEQLAALTKLNDSLAYAKTLYDRLYSTAKDLALAAQNSALNFADLASSLSTANSNGRISVTERKNIQSDGGNAQTLLNTLPTLLSDTGFDAYPDELAAQNLNLQSKIDLASNAPNIANLQQLSAANSAQLTLFSNSHTPNQDISHRLDNALSLASSAMLAIQSAQAAPNDADLLNTALNNARSVIAANEQLQSSIAGNRITLHPGEITSRSNQLSSALDSFTQAPSSTSSAAITQQVTETQSVILRIDTLSSSIGPRRTASLDTLAAASEASHTANNWPLIESSTRTAISQANALANAIATNGDNLTRESLAVASSRFASRLTTFNTVTTRTQADMVPYAEDLRLAAVDIKSWAEIINRQAGIVATQARKSPEASKSQSNPASAYTLAEQTLNSLNKSDGSLKKVQDAIDAPGKSSKLSAANAAIGDSTTLLKQLLASADSLQKSLHSSTAEAFPMLWYGSHCAFLQPGSDSTSWWLANQWANTTFFQISDRLRASTGKLKVNGTGTYRSVVLSAGQAIGSQNRENRRSASFFEGSNADPSRDGEASAPSTHFSSHPSSADFNDRLAY